MSTSEDLDVVAGYAASRTPLLFRIKAKILKSRDIVTVHSKYSWALTLENFCRWIRPWI